MLPGGLAAVVPGGLSAVPIAAVVPFVADQGVLGGCVVCGRVLDKLRRSEVALRRPDESGGIVRRTAADFVPLQRRDPTHINVMVVWSVAVPFGPREAVMRLAVRWIANLRNVAWREDASLEGQLRPDDVFRKRRDGRQQVTVIGGQHQYEPRQRRAPPAG